MHSGMLSQPRAMLTLMARRRVYVDELVGAAEIAERLGLAQVQTVHSWRRRYEDFPPPVARLRQALIWEWSEIAGVGEEDGSTRLERCRRFAPTNKPGGSVSSRPVQS